MGTRIRNRDALLAEVEGDLRRRRALALDLCDVALAAADPGPATAAIVRRWAEDGWTGMPVLAVGKAAVAMAEAALSEGARGGFVLGGEVAGLQSLPAAHPLPHPDCAAAARTLREGLRGPTLILLSGGTSAMLCDPAHGLDAGDLRRAHDVLLRSGMDIAAMNAVRARLDSMKGGGLARLVGPGSRAIVLSDVPGYGPEVVGSGPISAPGPLPPLPAGLPVAVVECLRTPDPPPPPGVLLEVAADNASVRRAVAAAARGRGLHCEELEVPLSGEAAAAGAAFARGSLARVGGGETAVVVRGDGIGGRNQEFALGAFDGTGLVVSLATDGVDGPSGSAGALLDDGVRARGLDPADHLARNDADAFFRSAGGRLETGPTGTNVADIAIYLP